MLRHSHLTAYYDLFHRRGQGAGSGTQVLHSSKSFRPGRGRDSWGFAPRALSGDCGTQGRTEPQLEAKRCRLCRHSIPIPRGYGVHQRPSSDHHKCTLARPSQVFSCLGGCAGGTPGDGEPSCNLVRRGPSAERLGSKPTCHFLQYFRPHLQGQRECAKNISCCIDAIEAHKRDDMRKHASSPGLYSARHRSPKGNLPRLDC